MHVCCACMYVSAEFIKYMTTKVEIFKDNHSVLSDSLKKMYS